MAITFHQTPQYYTPGSNPVIYTFSSDETAQANFSYIVEVYINAVLHSTHQVFQQSGIYAKFNASEIVRGLLSSPLITDGTLVTIYSSAFDFIFLKVTEQYGEPVTTHAYQYSGFPDIVFNGAFRHEEFINWDHTLYNISKFNPASVNPILYLTSWPRSKQYFCGLNEKVFLGFISGSNANSNIEFRLYNAANTQIASSLSNTLTFAYFSVIDASPQSIINNTSIISGDFTTCVYYTVKTISTSGGAYPGASEPFKIYIDTECQRYESRRLHWLNKFGVWDSFTFDLVSTDSTKVDGNRYEKEKGVWDGDNYVYPLYQGEQTTYSKRAEDTLTLNSDWIKEDVQQWLVRGLYESPSVYLENNGNFEPVNVTNASYKLKINRRDGLIQELVEIQRTYSFNSQLN